MQFIKKFNMSRWLFFGNYFYGICAVALAIEAALQLHMPLNDIAFYLLLFCATVFYYTIAYISESGSAKNERSLWYSNNNRVVRRHMLLQVLIMLAAILFILLKHYRQLACIQLNTLLFLLLIPLLAVLYYGLSFGSKNISIRNIAWLKPFVIAMVWTASANIYPAVYSSLIHGNHYAPNAFAFVLMLKNFMFLTVLAIMFDIKDYAMDYNSELKTFIVKVGLRKTIYTIIIPLCMLGFGTFLAYGFLHQFSRLWMSMNTIPYVLLLLVAFSLRQRRSIFYYLTIIDGLLLIKAVCGMLGALC
jgi:hypothetical protein